MQNVSGILLGPVEGTTAPLVYFFRHNGLPGDNADPAVAQAAPGSLYIRVDVPGLYQKQLDGTWKVATFS